MVNTGFWKYREIIERPPVAEFKPVEIAVDSRLMLPVLSDALIKIRDKGDGYERISLETIINVLTFTRNFTSDYTGARR